MIHVWQTVWRQSLAPRLSVEELESIRLALVYNEQPHDDVDKELLQEVQRTLAERYSEEM